MILMVLVILFALQQNRKGGFLGESDKPLPYPEFISLIKDQKIKSGKVVKDRFEGEYTAQRPITASTDEFSVVLPSSPEAQSKLWDLLNENHVPYEFKPPILSDWMQGLIFSIMLPLAFIAVIWIIFIRQAQSGGNQALSFGRSRAKRLTDNVPKVTFEDVAGVDEAKQELQEIVEFLKNAKKFQALGAKIPKGVLLLGPPGCGKTMLARAIAGEAGVPFFHISGSDFVEMFVGVGASRVRDLFDTAKSNRPSLIFIDEIDAVGRQRGAGLGGGHDEREQTLNQLLVEMDGFDPNAGVIMIAATNRPDVLDPALLRPGRFDRRVVVDAPDRLGRHDIFRVHARGKPLEFDANEEDREKALDSLAKRTPGFTGADIANLVNEAALLAARRDKTKITMAEFEESIDRVIAGPERKSRLLSDKDKKVVAFHEVGHAIVGELLPHADPVHKVSILPRGMALGYTISLPTEDKYNVSRSEIEDKIAMALGGRVAEELVFQEITTGATNDLDRATDMARAMVCEYGMSERLGPLRFGRRHGNPFLGRDYMEDRDYSEEVAQAIDEEVRGIVDRQYQRSRHLLETNRAKMDEIVSVLLQKETIEREEFLALMKGASLHAHEETPTVPPEVGAPPVETEKKRKRIEPRLRPEPGPA
jgi:cell division protease FtsH